MIIITGATKGIGKALVECFARAGKNILISARNDKEVHALAADIQKDYGVKVFPFSADLSQKNHVKALGAFALGLNEPVEVLINNVGFFEPGAVTEENEGVLERTIETNLYSAYYLSRALVPTMKTQKKGHIFNMCSIASFVAYANGGSYCISKFALLGFSKVLREELKPFGIKVTAVMPGATLTNSWSGTDLPEERFMKPEDIAETVFAAYSLSERSVVEEIIIRPQLGDI